MHADDSDIHLSPSSPPAHCPHSPMLQTASYTSYRLVRGATTHHHPHPINLSTTITLPGSHPSHTTQMDLYKKLGNRKEAPPKHEMVHFPGLLSSKREFGDFRTVLHTGLFSQVIAMEVPVGGDGGDEIHTVDQILFFTSGHGIASVAGVKQDFKPNDMLIVPAGTQCRVANVGEESLELVVVCAPAGYRPDAVHKTKGEVEQIEEKE